MYEHWTLNWCLSIKDINFVTMNIKFGIRHWYVSTIPLKIHHFSVLESGFGIAKWKYSKEGAQWRQTKVMESLELFIRTLYIHRLLILCYLFIFFEYLSLEYENVKMFIRSPNNCWTQIFVFGWFVIVMWRCRYH